MFEEIYNFLPLSENLFSSGMPKAGQLRDAAGKGIEVVINLAPHEVPDALPEEKELCRELGMHYINIPVVWNTPTEQGLEKFMDAMDEHSDRKILVHCQANFRASAFISMYRILRQGWEDEDALQVMHKIWDADAYPVWKMFIEDTLQNSRQGL